MQMGSVDSMGANLEYLEQVADLEQVEYTAIPEHYHSEIPAEIASIVSLFGFYNNGTLGRFGRF